MPLSRLNKLQIKADINYESNSTGDEDDAEDSDIDVTLVEGLEVNLKLTTTKESNDNGSSLTNTTTFYHCHDDPFSEQPNLLNWKHTCNTSCQHDDADTFIHTRQLCINFNLAT